MYNESKKKIIIIVILLVVMIAVGVGIAFAIKSDYELMVLDHNLQLAEFGFVKDDITMLSVEQKVAHCWLGVGIALGFLLEIASLLIIVGTIQDLIC